MALEHLLAPKIGVPVEEVGERIKELNEVLKKHNMLLSADAEIGVCFYMNEKTVKSLKLEVYLVQKEENKENA